MESELTLTPKLLQTIRGLSIIPYSQFAALTILGYDWLLTLDLEVTLVWMKKWNTIKVLYLFQRYAVILDACALSLYRQLGSDMTDVKCDRIKIAVGAIMASGTLSSEAILTLRVWAIWNRDKRLSVVLCSVAVMLWVPALVTLSLFFVNIKYTPTPPYQGYRGCFPKVGSAYIVWWWAVLCIWDFLCLALVLRPAVRFVRSHMSSRLPLSLVVYRDGVFFYIILFLCSFFNVLSYAILPISVRALGISLTRCLHSVLASRALLQMREQLQKPATDTMHFPSAFQAETDTNTIALEEVEGRRSRRITIEIS